MARETSAVVEKDEVEEFAVVDEATPETETAGSNGNADEAVPEVAVMEFTPRDVAPKSFTAKLVPIEEIIGWGGGDPPAQDFVNDIRRFGIEQPIRVRQEGERYVVIEGRRRLKTADLLLREEGRTEFEKVPVVIDTRKKAREAGLASLAMNYQRGENHIGDAYTVKAYLEQGWNEKQIAEESGLKIEQVRALRDIALKLDTRLIAAVEQGKMLPWAARMAARQPFPVQERLMVILETTGRVTADDVVEARNAGRAKTAKDTLPSEMYAGEDLPYDEDAAESGEPAGLPSAKHERKTKTGKVTVEDRRENALQLIWNAKQELTLIPVKQRTDDDEEVLQFIEEIITRLDVDFGSDERDADDETALLDDEMYPEPADDGEEGELSYLSEEDEFSDNEPF